MYIYSGFEIYTHVSLYNYPESGIDLHGSKVISIIKL